MKYSELLDSWPKVVENAGASNMEIQIAGSHFVAGSDQT
jgi:hypothetical protein